MKLNPYYLVCIVSGIVTVCVMTLLYLHPEPFGRGFFGFGAELIIPFLTVIAAWIIAIWFGLSGYKKVLKG